LEPKEYKTVMAEVKLLQRELVRIKRSVEKEATAKKEGACGQPASAKSELAWPGLLVWFL
jgi:hypothetical protein